MRRLGIHIDLIQAAMSDLNANAYRQEIITATNASLGIMAGKFAIGMLCRKITVTSSADGAFLPTNLAGFNAVRVSSDNQLVWERGEGAAGADESVYRYFTDVDVTAESDSGLPFVGEGAITAKGNEITCAELLTLADTETLAGLTLIISDEDYGDYYYEIDEVTSTVIVLKGNHPYAETAVEIRVRPNQTKRIHFVDDSETAITGTEFDVYYWIYPNPLTLDNEIIPLIYADALELSVIRRIPETKDRRPVSKSELEDAMKIARKAEPDQSVPSRPLNERGNVFTFSPTGKTPYKMRGE